jgi:TetR/AcrR family transcriptional regulator, mexJK operon transcriptional repressor
MTQCLERKRGRPKAVPDEQQRAYIVECARQLFVANGYGRTTTGDIAVACHISKQTLYRLFEGKCGLFTAVIEAHRQKMLDLQESYHTLPLPLALEKIFRFDIDDETDRERMALIQLARLEAQQFPELAAIAQQYGRDKLQAELAGWLRYHCERGNIVISAPESAAGMLMDMIFGPMVNRTLAGVKWPCGEERRTHIRRCINLFLYGACPR